MQSQQKEINYSIRASLAPTFISKTCTGGLRNFTSYICESSLAIEYIFTNQKRQSILSFALKQTSFQQREEKKITPKKKLLITIKQSRTKAFSC